LPIAVIIYLTIRMMTQASVPRLLIPVLKTLMLMSAKHDLEVVQVIKEIVIANEFMS
jgi:hypothetical protein